MPLLVPMLVVSDYIGNGGVILNDYENENMLCEAIEKFSNDLENYRNSAYKWAIKAFNLNIYVEEIYKLMERIK
ncbi:MAG: hypothetical protein U5N56_00755 [Candidatus Marinimicrobia bacterium]|nr:hypothetical protein [Candidatus Neomarinimicrobiota bacterium]